MAVRTITLTDEAPVRIEEDNWPIIAQASGAGVDDSPNTENHVVVRQHEDDRVIVYAVRKCGDAYERAGRVLDFAEELPQHIRKVGEQADVAPDIVRRCIADLPPVDLG